MLNRSRSPLMKWERLRLSPLRKPPWVLGLKRTPPREKWACPAGWWTAPVSSPLPVRSWRKCLTWWKGYVCDSWLCRSPVSTLGFVFLFFFAIVTLSVFPPSWKTWKRHGIHKCLEICPCSLRISNCLFFHPHVTKCVIFEDFEKKQWNLCLQFSLQHSFAHPPYPELAGKLTEIIHAYLVHPPLCWFIWGRKYSPLKYDSHPYCMYILKQIGTFVWVGKPNDF